MENPTNYSSSFPSLDRINVNQNGDVTKPRKILRGLKSILRKEIKDELLEEMNKSQNIAAKVDRANIQFKMKVFETLKRSAEKDLTVKRNLEQLKHDRVEKKMQKKLEKCRKNVKDAIQRRKKEHQHKVWKQLQRKRNIEDRLKVYRRHWKKMENLKVYYKTEIRKDMEEMYLRRRRPCAKKPNRLQLLVDYYGTHVYYDEPPALDEPHGPQDMLRIVLQFIAYRVVRDCVTRVLCFLLDEALKCIVHMSEATIKRIKKSRNEISYHYVEVLVNDAREGYVPAKPPPGFLASLLRPLINKFNSSENDTCSESLFELHCPSETPVQEYDEDMDDRHSVVTLREVSEASVGATGDTFVNSGFSSEKTSFQIIPQPTLPKPEVKELPTSSLIKVPSTHSTVSASKSSSCASSSLELFSSEDSIHYYVDKYEIDFEQECGRKNLNRTKYLIQTSSNRSPRLRTARTDSTSALCLRLKTKRQPLNSNNIYELLNQETSDEEERESFCHSPTVIEKVKVPEKVNPIRYRKEKKPKPEIKQTIQPTSGGSSQTILSDIFETSETQPDSLYWFYNSLRFLSTKVLDILCTLLTTLKVPRKSFEPFERFSIMKDFEELLNSMFCQNFDVINNDDLVLLIEKFFHFTWFTPQTCNN
ncbi:hypothetical protein M8J76_017346 [Diaphorina citri]|nr:hypothetical protein M8J75_001655 [Diaphorina citri]KAI5746107.1 hypothetical protein M8J76_017346 [Diaphorina citri]